MLILLIITLAWGCGSQQEKLVGTYTAVDGGSEQVSASLELSADGKGLWSIKTDNAPFTWDLYQNRIRLHTKSGGVIEGTIDNDTIQVTLPGIGLILFQRNH